MYASDQVPSLLRQRPKASSQNRFLPAALLETVSLHLRRRVVILPVPGMFAAAPGRPVHPLSRRRYWCAGWIGPIPLLSGWSAGLALERRVDLDAFGFQISAQGVQDELGLVHPVGA